MRAFFRLRSDPCASVFLDQPTPPEDMLASVFFAAEVDENADEVDEWVHARSCRRCCVARNMHAQQSVHA